MSRRASQEAQSMSRRASLEEQSMSYKRRASLDAKDESPTSVMKMLSSETPPMSINAAASWEAESYQRRRRRSSRASNEMAAEVAAAKIAAEREMAEAAAARAVANKTTAGMSVKDVTNYIREAEEEASWRDKLRRRKCLLNLNESHSVAVANLQQAQEDWRTAAASVPVVTMAVTSLEIASLVEPMTAAEAHAHALAEKIAATLSTRRLSDQ